jgi:hypothetical protein
VADSMPTRHHPHSTPPAGSITAGPPVGQSCSPIQQPQDEATEPPLRDPKRARHQRLFPRGEAERMGGRAWSAIAPLPWVGFGLRPSAVRDLSTTTARRRFG